MSLTYGGSEFSEEHCYSCCEFDVRSKLQMIHLCQSLQYYVRIVRKGYGFVHSRQMRTFTSLIASGFGML